MREWLIRLYPRTWRRRYGEEFATLLEQRSLTLWDVFDIIRSALEAHWSVLPAIEPEDVMTADYLRMRILLVLVIGVVLVFRRFMRSDAVVFGFDLVGLVGLTCLVLGLILSYYRRSHIKRLS